MITITDPLELQRLINIYVNKAMQNLAKCCNNTGLGQGLTSIYTQPSDSILWEGNGKQSTPLIATVRISESAGNIITQNSDGIFASLAGLSGAYWSLTGNSGTTPGTNFLGTTDIKPLMFKVNNHFGGLIGLYTDYSGFANVVTTGGVLAPAGTTFGQAYFGEYAGENSGTTWNTFSTLFGHGAMRKASQGTWIGGGTPQITAIGGNAGFYTVGTLSSSGNRSVFIGQSAGYRNFKGISNVFVGTYAGELNNNGSYNAVVGRDAMRSNIDGTGNVAIGLFSLLYNSTGIASIPVANGGSGYTTATVTISAPMVGSPGGYVSTATATATVSGGQVTGITIINPGAGYTSDPHTFDWGTQGAIVVTISGDGTGATAGIPVLQSGDYNTSLGYASGFGNILGQYNTHVGNFAGSGRGWDDYMTFIGSNATVDSSVTNSLATKLTKSVAIGYNAKVAGSNMMVLGGTGVDAVKVGIGKILPTEVLDVVGNVRFSQALMPNNLPGTSGYVLTSQGANTAPVWTNPSSLVTAIPTFQQTLIAGSTLTQNNTVNGGGFYFKIQNAGFDNLYVAPAGINLSIQDSVDTWTEFVEDAWHFLLSTQDSLGGANPTHHGDIFVESLAGGNGAQAFISAKDNSTYFSQAVVDYLGIHLTAKSTSGGTYKGINIALTGEVSFDTVNNDDTETKLLTWNSSSKNIEYRTVSSLPAAPTEGTYTPTLYNTTNISSSTAYVTNYIRVGDWVHVFGIVEIDATSNTTPTEMGMDLPIASTLGQKYNLAGTAAAADNSSVLIYADTTNNRAVWKFLNQLDSINEYSFHFSYKVI